MAAIAAPHSKAGCPPQPDVGSVRTQVPFADAGLHVSADDTFHMSALTNAKLASTVVTT